MNIIQLNLKQNKTAKEVGVLMIIIGIIISIGIVGLIDRSEQKGTDTSKDCREEISSVSLVESNSNFEVTLAKTEQEKREGLMYVKNLPSGNGMLFIYDMEVRHGFWMKNTLIPLDIIFISDEMKVVDIIENAQPCEIDPCPTYNPVDSYRYALEVNGGVARDNSIREGDTVVFEYKQESCVND